MASRHRVVVGPPGVEEGEAATTKLNRPGSSYLGADAFVFIWITLLADTTVDEVKALGTDTALAAGGESRAGGGVVACLGEDGDGGDSKRNTGKAGGGRGRCLCRIAGCLPITVAECSIW
uniref:Uncharacterized protein n=1 Tax=Arundo donax TaxID=35708 RepID=A0A0A9DCH6_ARUDO